MCKICEVIIDSKQNTSIKFLERKLVDTQSRLEYAQAQIERLREEKAILEERLEAM